MPNRGAILPLLAALVLLALALARPVNDLFSELRDRMRNAGDLAALAGTMTPPGDSITRAWSADHARTIRLAAGAPRSGPLASAPPGRVQTFIATFRRDVEGRAYVPYPVGRWRPDRRGLRAAAGGAANLLGIRYSRALVGITAAPPPGGSARFWILQDEVWLGDAELGEDARRDPSGASYVDITEPRLYRIARGHGEHVLKLSPADPGATLYAITFLNLDRGPLTGAN